MPVQLGYCVSFTHVIAKANHVTDGFIQAGHSWLITIQDGTRIPNPLGRMLARLSSWNSPRENSSVSTCPHHVRSETQGLQMFNVDLTCQQQCLLGFNLSGTGQRWKPLKTGIGPPLPTPGTLNYWKLNCCWVAGLLYWGIFSSFSMVQKNIIQKYVGCFPYV
jgi:hypothetical protein